MSIALEKRAEKVGIILAKSGITAVPPVRVGLVLDVSGSTQHLYNSGIMQKVVDRLIPVAMKFDDNGELDVWSFTTGFDQLESATAADEGSYVQDNILNNSDITKWGGTEYGPVLQAVSDFWYPSAPVAAIEKATGFFKGLFGKKAEAAAAPVATSGVDAHGQSLDIPALCLFITDGENSDKQHAAQVLAATANKNVYFIMIGVGPSHYFSFLEQQADLLGNVGFVNLSSLEISEEDLYAQLVGTDEFTTWIKTRVVKA